MERSWQLVPKLRRRSKVKGKAIKNKSLSPISKIVVGTIPVMQVVMTLKGVSHECLKENPSQKQLDLRKNGGGPQVGKKCFDW